MTINTEKLANILNNFVSSINDVEAAAIVSSDGLPIVTHLASGMDEENISAMSAAMLSLGEKIGVELSTGTLEQFYIEGRNGYVILTGCGEDAVLLVLASKSAKQGQLMISIKRTVPEIKTVLTVSEDLVEDLKRGDRRSDQNLVGELTPGSFGSETGDITIAPSVSCLLSPVSFLLKDFFTEDLVEDLEDFLSEDLSLQADLKNAVARLVDQEVVVEQGLVTSRKPDNIPAFNRKMIEEFAERRHQEQSGKGEPDSSAQLANSVGFTVEQVSLLEKQEAEAEQTQLIIELTRRIRQSLYLEDVLKTTVKEVRQALKADRVYFYRFNSDWSGVVVAESVVPGWPSCLKIKVTDTYFSGSYPGIEQYKNGRVCVNDDIYKAGLADCHLKLLEQFAIQAQMVAPIIKNNQLFALMVANQCSQPRTWEKHEVDLFVQLAKQVGFAVEQASLLEQQKSNVERSQLLIELTHHICQSLSLEDLFTTIVKEVRQALKTDRVLIYNLAPPNWDGTVVAESVAPGWPQTLNVKIDDPCFRNRHVEMYKNGQVTTINNIYQDPRVTDCYRKMLEQFAVKANLVAPILKNEQLVGLMIAHQCSAPRNWQKPDIDLFAQLANSVGIAVDQVSFLEQQEAAAERAQLLTEITRRIRQSLSLEDLLTTTVKEVRRALKTDRVIIVVLDTNNWDGTVVAESVAPEWPQILRFKINDPCYREGHLEMYKNGQVCAIDNIYQEPGLTDSYIKMLEQFAVKANLVAPIRKNEQLIGLMIAHHCSEPRTWEKHDVDLFAQLATPIGFAIDGASILKQMEPEQAR